MIIPLIQFEVDKKSTSFDLDSFSDVKYVKKYLKQSDNKSKAIPQFDQMINIVDIFSQIRTEAETNNRVSNYIYAFNKEKELPSDWGTINYLINPEYGEGQKEPPNRLINIIAKENFNMIQQLSTNLRKVLNRKRDKVPINRVQQLDSACLRWLTVQPGYTTAQKAGNKQRVLSVVRDETYNTLENRVFKDFLHLCIFECRRYIDEYSSIFPNSEKIKEVKRLQNLAITVLALPIFESVEKIVNRPKPNYVLQNNPTYKIIWDLYKKLLRKTKLLEILWPNRHFLFEQYIHITLINVIRTFNKNNWNNYFFRNPWIFLKPQSNKQLVTNYLDNECVIIHKNEPYYISLVNLNGLFYMKVQYEEKILTRYIIKTFFIHNSKRFENYEFELSDYNYGMYNSLYIIYVEDEWIEINTKSLKNKYIIINSKDDIYQTINKGILNILKANIGDLNV